MNATLLALAFLFVLSIVVIKPVFAYVTERPTVVVETIDFGGDTHTILGR